MGFLDRMVADMIGDATGLPVKRLVRKAGVKNLLLAGGAAAVLGVAAQKFTASRQAGQSSAPPPPLPGGGGSVPPPPLPPTPGAPLPPPPPTALPPVPGSEPAGEDLSPDLTYAVVRTMVAAALADGVMAPQEKTTIHGRLGESGLDPERIKQIHSDLVLPPSPHELAAMVGDVEGRTVLYRAALLVVMADHEVADLERAWLLSLAGALEIDDGRRVDLESDFLPPAE